MNAGLTLPAAALAAWLWQATAVGLAALVLLGIGRRWSPRARHGAIAVAFLAFAIPPLLRLDPVPSVGAAVGALARVVTGPGAWSGSWFASPVLAVWSAGTALVLTVVAAQAWAARRLCREAWPVEDATALRCYARAAHGLGVDRLPRLLASPRVRAPVVTGLWRPAIVLPPRLARRLDEAQLRLVLAHELAHVRQRDLPLNLVRAVLCAVWWPHPLIWVLARASRRAREECADDLVIEGLRPGPDVYARALLAAAPSRAESRLPLAALGALGASARALAGRIVRAADPTAARSTRLTPWQAALLVAACLLALNGPALEIITRTTRETTLTFVHAPGHRAAHRFHHAGHHPPDRN